MSIWPGLKRHFDNVAIAHSSSPKPALFITWISVALPFTSTTVCRSTVPEYFATRASSEYWGSILYTTLGALTPTPGL